MNYQNLQCGYLIFQPLLSIGACQNVPSIHIFLIKNKNDYFTKRYWTITRFDRRISKYHLFRIGVLNYQKPLNKGIPSALGVKSWQNTQNTPLLFSLKKKMLRFKCLSEFNEIYKNTYAWIFESF
jgi:hypothetical protein